MEKLKGYKTYVCVILGVIDVAAVGLGYIDQQTGGTILLLLGFGTAAGLRSAITDLKNGK